jgi:hypothetical protein
MNENTLLPYTPQDILRLAQLAGIPLDEVDRPRVLEALTEYVHYVNLIESVEFVLDSQPATVLDPSRWSAPTAPVLPPPAADG